jgi:hypothetical protein
LQAFTEGLIEGHIATDIIITISVWAGPRVYWPRGSVARSSCRTISKGERSISAMAGTPAQEEIDEPTGKFLRPRSEIAHFELLA